MSSTGRSRSGRFVGAVGELARGRNERGSSRAEREDTIHKSVSTTSPIPSPIIGPKNVGRGERLGIMAAPAVSLAPSSRSTSASPCDGSDNDNARRSIFAVLANRLAASSSAPDAALTLVSLFMLPWAPILIAASTHVSASVLVAASAPGVPSLPAPRRCRVAQARSSSGSTATGRKALVAGSV